MKRLKALFSGGGKRVSSEISPEKPEAATEPTTAQPEAATSSPEAARIAELEALVKEKESKFLYLYAEFENFKKRAFKERSDLMKFGWEGIASELLGVLDNLERGLAHAPAQTDANLLQGLKMVLTQFKSTIQKQGVEEIQSLGKPFDPHFHEALGEEPSDQASGTITQEHIKGFTLHGRLLRPARVIISSGPKSEEKG
ncbi:nucleotide exchange factor GrpE [Bdellovibrionota bacterium FG-2]